MAVLMIALVSVSFTACGSDDEEESSISKSELLGTWYTLEDDWVLVFNESSVTQYEILKNTGKYSLNSYTVTTKYTISGNRIVGEDGLCNSIYQRLIGWRGRQSQWLCDGQFEPPTWLCGYYKDR